MSNKKKIQEDHPDKEINRLVTFKIESGLTLNQRIIFSWLYYRCKRAGVRQSASILRISKATGICRKSVTAALKQLWSVKLIRRHPETKRWKFISFDEENRKFIHFTKWKDPAYNFYIQPKRPLTILDSLIYVADKYDAGRSNSLLAGRFLTKRHTVLASRRKLAGLDHSQDLWVDAKFKAKNKPASISDFLAKYTGAESSLFRQMAVERFKVRDIEEFVTAAKASTKESYDTLVLTLLGEGDRSFTKIMRSHRQDGNQRYSGVGLLLYRLKLGQFSVQNTV